MNILFDELAHAGPEHLDPEYAAAFDRKSPTDFAGDLEVLGTGKTVVDLGAGTGSFAVAAAKRFERVVAVDVSRAMLAELERRRPPNVECVCAGFLGYEHRGAPADAVYSRNALHHLPDVWKAVALTRVAGILRPGGTFLLRDLVFDCEPGELDEVLEPWLGGAVAQPEDGWTRTELEEHLRAEHSTFSWLLEPMLTCAGFQIADVTFRQRVYAAYTCVRA